MSGETTVRFCDPVGCDRKPVDPLVSVIIPTYNRARLLRRALDSVLSQTFQDFEVLVVDDGSTDDTEEAVAAFVDPRIRYLRQLENRGVSAARNRGMEEARGEYVAFLDSDDEWLPKKLDLQLRVFRAARESVGLVYTGAEVVYEDGAVQKLVPEHRGRIGEVVVGRNVIVGGMSGVMLRRTVVEHVGGLDEAYPAIEDWDYWVRIAASYEVDYEPRVLVRLHESRHIPRKSLEVEKNLHAREIFYRRHSEQMRKAGVASDYLYTSARRHLNRLHWDPAEARRLMMEALRQRPTALRIYPLLVMTVLPRPAYRLLALVKAAVRSAASVPGVGIQDRPGMAG